MDDLNTYCFYKKQNEQRRLYGYHCSVTVPQKSQILTPNARSYQSYNVYAVVQRRQADVEGYYRMERDAHMRRLDLKCTRQEQQRLIEKLT
jgi:hypothetical protein